MRMLIEMGFIEDSYSNVLKGVFIALNPIKKRIIKTECKVHRFLNNQGIEILKNDGHIEAYKFLNFFINDINSGGVWADQDFKSSNHFYDPTNDSGLYGRSNAKLECIKYYSKALKNFYHGDINQSMFYLGVACHLLQDMSVPQHVNRKLLSHHRKYEQWVIRTYEEHDKFKINSGGRYLNSLDSFINYNTNKAYSAYLQFLRGNDMDDRYYRTTLVAISAAQRTTAGLMYKFYRDISGIIPIITESENDELKRTV